MAYLNEEDTFYAEARVFTKKNQRRNYILLATVSNSFIHTYQEKVKTAGTIIVQEKLKYKKERTKSERSPDYDHIARMVELRIEQRFEDVVEKQPSHNKESLMNFKELLLTDISLIQLFNQQEKRGEFRETFINNAQKYATKDVDIDKTLTQHIYE